MTRISLHDLLLDEYEDTEKKEKESGNEKKKSKKAFVTLTFLIRFDGFKYNRYCSIPIEGAKKLTLKQFIRCVHEKVGGVGRNLRQMTDVRIFYTDEEDDDIFVGCDDEYKELIKIAAMKNKEGFPMVVNFLGQAKRNSISRKEKRSDPLGRDSRTSPGKVMKSSATKLRSKNVLGLKTPVPEYDSEVKAISEIDKIAEKVMSCHFPKMDGNKKAPSSPSNHEILKQEASVFDWMTTNGKIKEDCPPAWFLEYMETFKEELVSEVTAKVVHSLGVVIENKLSGLDSKKTTEQKQQVKVSTKKMKKPRDSEKVKKEAIRMTMEINEEAESKELKKLKKSLIKKTDKVVKIAMKIEKKQNQEERGRKPSLTSANTEVGMNFPSKQKTRKRKTKKPKDEEARKTRGEVNYPVSVLPDYPLSPVPLYPLVPVQNYPLVKCEDNRNIIEQIMSKHCESAAKRASFEKILQKIGVPTVEVPKPKGELANAVFVSDNENIWKAEAGSEVKIRVGLTNMSCLEWDEKMTVQHVISCQPLSSREKMKSLPALRPGEEGSLEFNFTAPEEPGLYESVWHIFDNNKQFGPPLIFKIIVPTDDNADATELTDFGTPGVEMKSLGSCATSQEMVEINKIVDVEDSEDSEDSEAESQDENESEDEDEEEENEEEEFDLLAAEVDSLALNSKKDEDFEVIPIPVPDCFNLEVPFEIVAVNDSTVTEGAVEDDDNEEDDVTDNIYAREEKQDENPINALEELASAGLVSVGQTHIAEIVDKLEDVKTMKVVTAMPEYVDRLVLLGFADREENKKLLVRHQNDMDKVLEGIYEERGRDWAAARH